VGRRVSRGRTFDMAEVRVGLGALFFAPNRRFMMAAAAWGGFGSRSRVCGRIRRGLCSRGIRSRLSVYDNCWAVSCVRGGICLVMYVGIASVLEF
jgi:hypothetical protein